jgi:hypothetical protein
MGQHQSFSHREGDPTAAQRRSGGWRVAPTAQQAAPKVIVALGPACEEEQMMVGAGDGGHEKVKIGGGGSDKRQGPLERMREGQSGRAWPGDRCTVQRGTATTANGWVDLQML